MSEKLEPIHTNGVWIRFIITTALGLLSVYYFSFKIGEWTAKAEANFTALQKVDTLMDVRMKKIEDEGSVPLKFQVQKLEMAMSNINIALQENAKAHGEILSELRSLEQIHAREGIK